MFRNTLSQTSWEERLIFSLAAPNREKSLNETGLLAHICEDTPIRPKTPEQRMLRL